MSGRGRDQQSVKVVIINTKFVETDAMSFKDVVQRLTGKDSMVAYEVQEPHGNTTQHYGIGRSTKVKLEPNTSISTGGMSRNNSVLMRDFSFKEFERLLREMPPMEDFWAD